MKKCSQANCKIFEVKEDEMISLNLSAARTCTHCTHNSNAISPTQDNWILKDPVGGCNKMDCRFYIDFDKCKDCESCWYNPRIFKATSLNYQKG